MGSRDRTEKDGIRELSGWDFVDVVNDPDHAVLVEFVSRDCHSCTEFASAYAVIGRKVAENKRKDPGRFAKLVIARIDQTINEYPILVKGTPWSAFGHAEGRKRQLMLRLVV